jgi:urea transport system ATP-binding protein
VRTGSILFDGADMTTMPPHQRARAGIGYVPQGRGIFPYLTVFENLCMGFESVPGARIDPDGIDRMYATFPILKQMSRRVAGTLSGGQQQQLAIARALVRRPRLLLLDEPTEGIQPSIMHEIEDVIVSLQQQGDMAILLVEQFVDFALGVAEHFYVMQTGRIVAEGAVRDFRQEIAKEYLTF